MKRYFESFYNADPMDELGEAAARQLGTYAGEDDPALRRYHRIIAHQLDSIIYAGWDEPAVPLADLERLGATVRAEIHSTVQRLDHGGYRWRTWYLDPQRKVTKILGQSTPQTAVACARRCTAPFSPRTPSRKACVVTWFHPILCGTGRAPELTDSYATPPSPRATRSHHFRRSTEISPSTPSTLSLHKPPLL